MHYNRVVVKPSSDFAKTAPFFIEPGTILYIHQRDADTAEVRRKTFQCLEFYRPDKVLAEIEDK